MPLYKAKKATVSFKDNVYICKIEKKDGEVSEFKNADKNFLRKTMALNGAHVLVPWVEVESGLVVNYEQK